MLKLWILRRLVGLVTLYFSIIDCVSWFVILFLSLSFRDFPLFLSSLYPQLYLFVSHHNRSFSMWFNSPPPLSVCIFLMVPVFLSILFKTLALSFKKIIVNFSQCGLILSLSLFLKNGLLPSSLFFLIFVFSIQLIVNKFIIFVYDWIRSADLWRLKRPLYQLSNNQCPLFAICPSLYVFLCFFSIRFIRYGSEFLQQPSNLAWKKLDRVHESFSV